jgi:hypothetical protein
LKKLEKINNKLLNQNNIFSEKIKIGKSNIRFRSGNTSRRLSNI